MILRLALAGLLVMLVAFEARAEKRVALIIGNSAYAKTSKLPNPTRDADAVQALFRAMGFDVVEVKRDLGTADMRRALRDFSDQVRGADIAVVFYAGHGIEVNGTNYLVPVDAALERDTDVEDEAISLDRVTRYLEQAKRLRLVILDACRDNPFTRSMKRSVGTRSIGRGLAKVEDVPSDTLIAYAAKAGSTAADGEEANSPYTTALVKHLATPGLDVQMALRRVRDEVLKSTASKQEPFLYGSLGGTEISLVPGAKPFAVAVVPPQPVAPTGAQQQSSEAERAWGLVKDTANVSILEEFIKRYGDTFHAALARAKLEELKKQQAAAAAPPPARPAVLPRADPPKPAIDANPTSPESVGPGQWIELGCKQISLSGQDHDTIRVGRRSDRFRAIRLHVRGTDVNMLDLRVVYANGQADDIAVRQLIRHGDRTRPFNLNGWEHAIDRVECLYRSRPNFSDLATVCVEGLK